jgi:hypothetical protein
MSSIGLNGLVVARTSKPPLYWSTWLNALRNAPVVVGPPARV